MLNQWEADRPFVLTSFCCIPTIFFVTLNRVRITIDFSFGSGIFVYEKSHGTASAYRDLRKSNIKRKNKSFFLYNPLFFNLVNE